MKIFVSVVIVLLMMFSIVYGLCHLAFSGKPEVYDSRGMSRGAWTDLGAISDGVYGVAQVMKRIDPDNGAVIYVMMGAGRGGIYVLPAPPRPVVPK